MINFCHGQRNQYNSTPFRTLACTIVFLDLTAFFFLSFMNICFDTIVSNPPAWLLFSLFLIMALDLLAELYFRKRITINFGVNLSITVLLALSWMIEIPVVIFLSGLVFLRFPQVVRYNEIMQDKLRSHPKSFKLYTIAKIFYMIAVVGHVLGCIFYAIDNILIKEKYYGDIAQNPSLYYQGQLLCYTPIYALSEINRYLYCMYYIVSLLATVAYGDIIPKNPFENAYVCLLLVLSTVSISFIIEQLLIVLSGNWDTIYTILKKLKYFDSMLAKSASVSSTSRLNLTNFVFHAMLHEASNDPNISRLTRSLQSRLMEESIGLKKFMHTLGERDTIGNIGNMRMVSQYSVPSFLAEYLLLKLQIIYLPSKYLLVDNENPFQDPRIFITLKGQITLGYGPNLLMRKTISYRSKLFCWREFVLDNKSVHRYFRVESKTLCDLYTVSSGEMKAMIKSQRDKSISDDNYNKMLQMYHKARQTELTLMHEQNTQVYHSTQSLQLINFDPLNPLEPTQHHEAPSHMIRCWGCGRRTHLPLQCPNLHYKINVMEAISHAKRDREREYGFGRKGGSRKIRPMRKVQAKEEVNRILVKKYLAKKNIQLKNLRNSYQGARPRIFQQYEPYQNYYNQFNFSSNNFQQ